MVGWISRPLRCRLLFALALTLPRALSAADPGPDYKHPQRYLAAGPQSRLAPALALQIEDELDLPQKTRGLAAVAAVHFWMRDTFQSAAEGGSTVGKSEVNGLVRSRRLAGCHDWALVLAAVLRLLGAPAIMVDTAGLKWAAAPDPKDAFIGHVFVETLVGGRWMLIDPVSGRYIPDYDPAQPVIALPVGDEPQGYHVLRKGPDPQSYGVTSNQALQNIMTEFAARLPGLPVVYPESTILQLARPRGRVPRISEAQVAGPCELDPAHKGQVLQLEASGLDLHIEKAGNGYVVHSYPYGRVFQDPESDARKFATLKAANAYIKRLAR
ncbi:MAG: transglutaminase domain-containing protein [Elusimicrobiota bacterium]|jgi:hypothetical protein